MAVTRFDITKAARKVGIRKGDIVMTHSSFKSLGEVEGGAETVISGLLDAVGDEGTLVLPTFSQKNFESSYQTWHMDKPSDTGYLTEYFRKREGSLRSDQATHSVAAFGKYARELTITHGHTHKREGNCGDTPFSADSPFEKMYNMNGRILMIGCGALYITYRHYAEYLYIERELKSIEAHPDYLEMKNMLSAFNKKGVWPSTNNMVAAEIMKDMGYLYTSMCGDAEFLSVPVKEFVDMMLDRLHNYDPAILRRSDSWSTEDWIAWTVRVRQMREELK